MKKIMAVLTVLMCFASTSVFAQEVRGIETKRVVYEGPNYGYYYCRETHYTICEPTQSFSNRYYGWEFTNRNSCSVSVDVSLIASGTVITTKCIVLEAGESYTFKYEGGDGTKYYMNRKNNGYYDTNSIDFLYVEYKAFKLQ